MKVLIVDDELLIRKTLKKVFEKKGCEVSICNDGLEALTLWKDNPPDLVILDVLMPKMGGVELLNLIAESEDSALLLKAYIVMISAYSAGGTEEDFLRIGANHFVRKPFDEVFKFVDDCMSRVGKKH